MRHRRNTRRLSRNTPGRKALLRSLIRSLLISERISTTHAKAKEASSLADRVITLGKRNTITSKKTAISILGSKQLINKLFGDIAPRFVNRKGGYTRIFQLAPRKGDGAKMAILELTERRIIEKPTTKKPEKQKKEEALKSEVPPKTGESERKIKEAKKEPPKRDISKPISKEERPAPPKPAPMPPKERVDEERDKGGRAKTEKGKYKRQFFTGLKRYFRRKTI